VSSVGASGLDSTSPVSDALRALPKDFRACVVVVYVLGFSYRDACEILGIREGTLASRLHTARAQLRTALRPSPESKLERNRE
jgi:DNA-directed RNA polymerase specialized sigma24 family protein